MSPDTEPLKMPVTRTKRWWVILVVNRQLRALVMAHDLHQEPAPISLWTWILKTEEEAQEFVELQAWDLELVQWADHPTGKLLLDSVHPHHERHRLQWPTEKEGRLPIPPWIEHRWPAGKSRNLNFARQKISSKWWWQFTNTYQDEVEILHNTAA